MSLKQEFNQIVNKYITQFCKKQGLDIEDGDWIGFDNIGTIYTIADMYFNFDDIRLDVDNSVRKGVIIDWYYKNIENEQFMNYKTYLKIIK